MNHRLRSLYRADSIPASVGAAAVASLLSRLIGFVRTAALAWLIPQAQFGLFAVALLIINVLLPVCCGGVYEGVTRYVPLYDASGTLRPFFKRSSALLLVLTAVTTVLFGLWAESCGGFLFSTVQRQSAAADVATGPSLLGGLMRASLLCVMVLVVYQTMIAWFKGLRMFRALAVAEVLTAVVFTVLALGAAWLGFTTARALILVYAVACTTAVLVFVPGLIVYLFASPLRSARWVAHLFRGGGDEDPDNPSSPRRKPWTTPGRLRFLRYSLWAAGTALLWHALSYFPMWYLLKVSDRATVGTFHAVRTITQMVQIAAVLLTTVVAAHLNRVWEHDGRDAVLPQLTALTKASVVFLFLAATFLSLIHPIVMRIFPAAFASGTVAYDPLVLFFFLVGVLGLVAIRLNLVEKPRLVFAAWLAGSAVNVMGSYLYVGSPNPVSTLLPADALFSAAWAGVAGATAALVVCAVAVKREGLGLNRSTIVLIGAAFSVGWGWVVALPVLVLVILLVVLTRFLFSNLDRAQLRAMRPQRKA